MAVFSEGVVAESLWTAVEDISALEVVPIDVSNDAVIEGEDTVPVETLFSARVPTVEFVELSLVLVVTIVSESVESWPKTTIQNKNENSFLSSGNNML